MLLSLPASAVDLVCSVPGPNVARASQLCAELRQALHIRSADWSNSICASQFLRLGLIQGEKSSTRRLFLTTVAETIGVAVDDFTLTWPPPVAATCGDGILDAEFGEQCDDGNSIPGDGCTSCVLD